MIVDCRSGFASKDTMERDGDVWQAAMDDADLTEAERRGLEELVRRDQDLHDEVRHLVGHLSANLGGSFVRAFVDLLREQGARRRPAGLVLPALQRVIGGHNRRGGDHG